MGKLVLAFTCLILAVWAAGYHVARQPTPDQLYGCTLVQQSPNGDCP